MIAALALATGLPPRELLAESPEMLATLADLAARRGVR
jgi:hypothetical protein